MGLLLRGLIALISVIGNALTGWYWKRVDAKTPTLPHFLVRDSTRMVGGVMIEISTVGRVPFVQVRARRLPGYVPCLVREHDWADRDRPPVTPRGLTTIAHDARGDEEAARALPAFEASWRALVEIVGHAVLVSDGEQVIGWMLAEREEQVEQLVRVVVAVARWDVALAKLLAELPGARAIDDATMAPAVVVPGDIRVGRRDDHVEIAAGTAIRRVDRDRARILAAIEELRASQNTAPFR